MKYTNNKNYPAPFVRAVENDPYDSGKSDFTATSISRPARATVLFERFKDVLEVDVSTRTASILGQGTHSLLERVARPGIDIIEERYFMTIDVDGIEYILSAQIDLFEKDTGILYDWKTTKALAFTPKYSKKAEWEIQLNIGAMLLERQEKLAVKGLMIIGILKDWNERIAQTGLLPNGKEIKGYPQADVATMDLGFWDPREYLSERIRAVVEARKKLPECTPKETWNGRRCAQYCDVASVCEQYQKKLMAFWPE